ncbi:MAG: DNA replication/repair protein RecF, partial [Caulobacteraceae bacterium]
MRSRIDVLKLADFRSYASAELDCGGRSVFLVGLNGAGKTNLLEALSLLAPGRGLRNASLGEIERREPPESQGRVWSVWVKLSTDSEGVEIGSGLEAPGGKRRIVKIDGNAVPSGRLAKWTRPMWLTPAQDGLLEGGSRERRRFFDRLVFAAEPEHAAQVAAYERALRERARLLETADADRTWLTVVERRMAASGALIAIARSELARSLSEEIARRAGPFPKADLRLDGTWERLAAEGLPAIELERRLAEALAGARSGDAAAGRALVGPHRGDLVVRHLPSGRPAQECSTGEQKALVINLILAQAARLSRAEWLPTPILLLDEVAAHHDPVRRAALIEEIE